MMHHQLNKLTDLTPDPSRTSFASRGFMKWIWAQACGQAPPVHREITPAERKFYFRLDPVPQRTMELKH